MEAISRAAPAVPVTFLPLETVRQPETLITVLAAGLRVPDQAGVPLPDSVAAALAGAPRLIVLDGAEHLRDAVAVLAGQLLSAAPGVRIVVTSRVVLGAPGEVCWTVPPLDCPSAAAGAADVAGSDAVQLFVARARERLPSFSVSDVPPHAIGELCRRLDGLPLAIELIAGWVGALSVREILQQRAILLDQDAPGAAPARRPAARGRGPGQLRPAGAGGTAAARRAQRVRRVVHGRRRPGRQRRRARAGAPDPRAGRFLLAAGHPGQ